MRGENNKATAYKGQRRKVCRPKVRKNPRRKSKERLSKSTADKVKVTDDWLKREGKRLTEAATEPNEKESFLQLNTEPEAGEATSHEEAPTAKRRKLLAYDRPTKEAAKGKAPKRRNWQDDIDALLGCARKRGKLETVQSAPDSHMYS